MITCFYISGTIDYIHEVPVAALTDIEEEHCEEPLQKGLDPETVDSLDELMTIHCKGEPETTTEALSLYLWFKELFNE